MTTFLDLMLFLFVHLVLPVAGPLIVTPGCQYASLLGFIWLAWLFRSSLPYMGAPPSCES